MSKRKRPKDWFAALLNAIGKKADGNLLDLGDLTGDDVEGPWHD